MSYTQKVVEWEHCSDKPIVDIYGDVKRNVPVKILARKQPTNTIVKTSDGREFVAKSVYYVDPRIEPNALSIERMDKLDGELIEDRYVMCGLNNSPKMVRFITV